MSRADRLSYRITRISSELGEPDHHFYGRPRSRPECDGKLYHLLDQWYRARDAFWGTLTGVLTAFSKRGLTEINRRNGQFDSNHWPGEGSCPARAGRWPPHFTFPFATDNVLDYKVIFRY